MRLLSACVLALVCLGPATAVGADNLYAPATDCEMAASGCPRCYWPWARPQKSCNYVGYYVGGGNPLAPNRGRCAYDGTWGWDYSGEWLPRLVRLGWWQHPKRQGETGQYEPDGPRVVEHVTSHVTGH